MVKDMEANQSLLGGFIGVNVWTISLFHITQHPLSSEGFEVRRFLSRIQR